MCIKTFLSHQQFHIHIKNTFLAELILVNRVPQRAVLNPTLFNIVTNDIASVIHRSIKITQFVYET